MLLRNSFNELLHDYRAEVLPTIVENWNLLTEIEQEQMTSMICELHFLIALADTLSKNLGI